MMKSVLEEWRTILVLVRNDWRSGWRVWKIKLEKVLKIRVEDFCKKMKEDNWENETVLKFLKERGWCLWIFLELRFEGNGMKWNAFSFVFCYEVKRKWSLELWSF